MDSSNASARNARTSRKHDLGAESLEGRQLLATSAGATAPAVAVPAQAGTMTPTDWSPMSNFGGGRGFGRMGMMSQAGGGYGGSSTASLAGGGSGVNSGSTTAGYAAPDFATRGNFGGMRSMMADRFGGGAGLGGGEYGSVLRAGGSTGTTTASTLTPQERMQALQQLRADEQAVADKSTVTNVLKAAVRNDLAAVRKGVTATPDLAKLQALQTDLQAVAGTLPTASQLAQIQSDYAAVLNSEGVTDAAAIDQAFSDAQKVVAATNITAADLTKIAADQTAAGLPSGLGADRLTRSVDLGSLLGVGSLNRRSIRFNAPMTPPASAPVATPTSIAATTTTTTS